MNLNNQSQNPSCMLFFTISKTKMNENEHKSNKLRTGIFLIILLSELFFNNQYYDSIVVLFIKPTWNVSRDWPYLFYHDFHALFLSLPVFPNVHIFQEKYFWEYILMLLRAFWFNRPNSYPVGFQPSSSPELAG